MEHNWDDDIHIIRFLDSCQDAGILCTLHQQEKHVPGCKCKFTRERIVTTLKEHKASPSFLLLGGQCETTSTPVVSTGTSTSTSHTTTGTTRYHVMKPDGGTSTHRSGNTGRSLHDRTIRSMEASSEPSLLDCDFCQPVTEDRIVAKLNGNCLMGCGVDHDAFCCPLIQGNKEQQEKTFTSLSAKRRFHAVRAIATIDDVADDIDVVDGDADLIDLNDQDDLNSGSDQDFP